MRSAFVITLCTAIASCLFSTPETFGQTSSRDHQSLQKDARTKFRSSSGASSHAVSYDQAAAIQRIRSQAGSLQEDWRRRGEQNAQSETTAGEAAAANYRSQARARAIESMGAPRGVPRLDEATLEEQARQRGEVARRNASVAGEIDKQIAERHAAATAECAHDLEKQLTEQNESSKGVLLNPVGTNLYVRNYQFHPAPPVVPLRTNVKAILSPLAKTSAKVGVPASKDYNHRDLRGNAAGLRVHGELLPSQK